jgi:excisionase family DNA binding protein
MTTTTNTAKPDSLPPLLTPQAVLDYLGVSKSTFARWTREGNAPPRIKLGRHVLFRQDELLAWLDSQKVTQPPVNHGPYDQWR